MNQRELKPATSSNLRFLDCCGGGKPDEERPPESGQNL